MQRAGLVAEMQWLVFADRMGAHALRMRCLPVELAGCFGAQWYQSPGFRHHCLTKVRLQGRNSIRLPVPRDGSN